MNSGERYQTLLGATGTGKTFTMANVIAQTGRPAWSWPTTKPWPHSFAAAAGVLPGDTVEYFISYYDYAPAGLCP